MARDLSPEPDGTAHSLRSQRRQGGPKSCEHKTRNVLVQMVLEPRFTPDSLLNGSRDRQQLVSIGARRGRFEHREYAGRVPFGANDSRDVRPRGVASKEGLLSSRIELLFWKAPCKKGFRIKRSWLWIFLLEAFKIFGQQFIFIWGNTVN